MKVTRRALAQLAAAAVHAKAQERPPAPPAAGGLAEQSPMARQLAEVKLPRATEPATRFEA